MSVRLVLSLLLLVVALPANTEAQSLPTVFVPPPTHASGSAHAAYVPSTEREAPEHARPRRSRGLLIAGPLLAGPSLLNGIVGLFVGSQFSSGPEDPRLKMFHWVGFVPLAGPWMQLWIMGPSTFGRDAWGPWLLATGLLQATGLALLIAGLVQSSQPAPDEPYVSVLPTASSDGAGLMVSGRF